MKIRCSNPECESREGQDPLFNVRVEVDGDFNAAESIKKIDAEHFECCFCHSEAELAS